ncbi:MAG TPA: hypothetical protein VKZ74_04200 [Natronosporangium sp.]|nr:hypothetical protein [Natronosporangium sp.]
MRLGHYLELLRRAQGNLARGYRAAASAHQAEVDIFYTCQRLASQADGQIAALAPYLARYPVPRQEEPAADPSAAFHGPRGPGVGLLRDLQDLYLMAAECDLSWLLLDRSAQGVRDAELLLTVRRCHDQTRTQLAWLRTQLTQSSVQALVVA